MLPLLLLFSLAANAAADTYCMLNSGSTDCQYTNATSCVNNCTLCTTQAGCMTQQSCNWISGGSFGTDSCSAVGTDACASYDSSTCPANCTVKTNPCKFSMQCQTSGSPCNWTSTGAQCTAQGAQCTWNPTCMEVTPCGMADNATQCTGMAGCFWSQTVTSDQGSVGMCSPCFADPSKIENQYLSFQAHVNDTCYPMDQFGLDTSVIQIVSVAGGSSCSTGAVVKPFPRKICGAPATAEVSCSGLDETTCPKTTASSCVNSCSVYQTQAACAMMSMCSWQNNFGGYQCAYNGTDDCYQYSLSTVCNGVGYCTWQTAACRVQAYCSGSGNCGFASTSAACAAVGGCIWNAPCYSVPTCEVAQTQADCTVISGCYWTTSYISQTDSQISDMQGLCSPCFSGTLNNYKGTLANLNTTCSVNIAYYGNASIALSSASAASSGCTGGTVAPPTYKLGSLPASNVYSCQNGIVLPPPSPPFCTLNMSSNACQTPTVSSCVNTCSLYASLSGCKTVPGCQWVNQTSFGNTYEVCVMAAGVDDCGFRGSDTCTGKCTWQVLPCQTRSYCSSTGSNPCTGVSTAAACTAQGAYCTWTTSCNTASTCEVPDTATKCTAISGCFWASFTSKENSTATSQTDSACVSCYVDRSNTSNLYLAYKPLLGKTCTVANETGSTSVNTLLTGANCGLGSAYQIPEKLTCTATNGANRLPVVAVILLSVASSFFNA